MFDLEIFGTEFYQCTYIELAMREVGDGMALKADEVMMPFRVRLNANRAVVRADFADDSSFHEGVQSLVNRRQRNGRQLRADTVENLLGTGVIRHLHQLPIDNQPLMRHGQVFLPAELLKVRFEGPSHELSI